MLNVFSRICLIFSLVSGPWAAFGFADSTVDITSTCNTLIQQKSIVRAGEPSALELVWKIIFNRSSFVSPLPVLGPVLEPASGLPSEISSTLHAEKLTIFTLGYVQPVTKSDKAAFKKIARESKRQITVINTLLKTKTLNECVARAQTIGWSPDQLVSLQGLEASALQSYRHQESEVSLKVAEAAKKNHPDWNIVPVDSWGEVLQSLRKNPVSGMIFIGHSDPEGVLYDSQRDELPPGFFKAIPDAVQFIGVFSCESDAVVKAYQLEQLGKGRDVVAVKLGAPFDAAETTPIQFFPSWVRKLEKEELLTLKIPENVPAESECSVSMEGLQLQNGRLSVSMGAIPVGVLSSENAQDPLLFPCSAMSAATSMVVLEPSQSGLKIQLGDSDFSARIQDGTTTKDLGDKQVFSQPNGDFRSAILSNDDTVH